MTTIFTGTNGFGTSLEIVEFRPSVRTIVAELGGPHRFRLAFPHVVFAGRRISLEVHQLYAFWRPGPAEPDSQGSYGHNVLYPMIMPNVRWSDGRACVPMATTLPGAIEKFWSSKFTPTWTEGVMRFVGRPHLADCESEGELRHYFRKWQADTAAGKPDWGFANGVTLADFKSFNF